MANYDVLKNREVKIRLDKGKKLELHKHNIKVQLNKKTGPLVMAALFISVLYSANLAYGLSATSLEELESQLKQENSLDARLANYKAALIDYIETHNITVDDDLNQSSIDDLEKIVESNMDTCNSASSKNDASLQGNC